MRKPIVEVNLEGKTLSVNGNITTLDDSFVCADMSKINAGNETVIELGYQADGDLIEDEGARLYEFVEKYGFDEQIEVTACPDKDCRAVSLVGDYEGRLK